MSDIRSQTVENYLRDVAARQSTPGGGAVAAIVVAEAAALIAMVAEFSDTDQSPDIIRQCHETIESVMGKADADAVAFKAVMKAYKSGDGLSSALVEAASVPASVSESALSLISGLEHLLGEGNQNLVSDIGIAASLLDSALTACEMNIRINIKELTDPPEALLKLLTHLDAARESLRKASTQVMQQLS